MSTCGLSGRLEVVRVVDVREVVIYCLMQASRTSTSAHMYEARTPLVDVLAPLDVAYEGGSRALFTLLLM